jgi:hypothetical protein
MRRIVRSATFRHLAAGAALVLGSAGGVRAEWEPQWQVARQAPAGEKPAAPAKPAAPQPAPGAAPRPESEAQPAPTAPAPDFGSEQGLAGAGSGVALGYPGLKGDLFGLPFYNLNPLLARQAAGVVPLGSRPAVIQRTNVDGVEIVTVVSPAVPPTRQIALFPGDAAQAFLVPPVRTFKIAENESPEPRDRAYLDFNYFDNVAAAVNQHFGVDLHNVNVYRETFGLEKTFLGGDASVGLRLPVNTLGAESGTPGFGGTDTDAGDLTTILKFALWRDADSGSLVSAGAAVTLPTGPGRFAGSPFPVARDTFVQPFLGFVLGLDRLFVQGFVAVDVPTDGADATFLYTDLAVGYYVYRNPARDRLLNGIAPTVEVHVNDPLNHRGALQSFNLNGAADVVDLTVATTFDLGQRTSLSVGVVAPLTGPKPFDVEAMVQLNWNFGARGVGGR